MQLISIDNLESISKDVTLQNGAKHRCIDATQIHELPKVDLIRCKDCIYYHKGNWYDDDVCKVHSNNDRGYCAWGERNEDAETN